MTKQQFLLLKLSEECAEVAQRCSKQIQFGKDEKQKNQELTNKQRLSGELLDLLAVANLLAECGEVLPTTVTDIDVATLQKKTKMQKYLDLSTELCQLPEIRL